MPYNANSGSVDYDWLATSSGNGTFGNPWVPSVAIVSGGGGGGTSSSFGAAFPATGTAIGVSNGTNMVAVTFGQATMANSIPVVLSSNQAAIPVTAGGAGNFAVNVTQVNSHTLIDGQTAPQTTVNGMQNSIPVAVYNTSAPSPTNGQVIALQADSAANLKVNPGVHNGSISQTGSSVGTSSGSILASNANRTSLEIQNVSTTATVWIAFGTAAVTTQPSLQLLPGAMWSPISTFIPTQQVFAIASAATTPVTIMEGS